MNNTIREIKDSYERTLSEKDEKISKLEKQVENLQKQLLTEMDEKQIIRQFFDMGVTLFANGYLPDIKEVGPRRYCDFGCRCGAYYSAYYGDRNGFGFV